MTYKAIFERDPTGVWTVELAHPREVHTWGRSIDQARSRLREALGLWLEDDRAGITAEFENEFRLPSRARSVVKSARELRVTAQSTAEKSQAALRLAVRQLIAEQHLSVRDAAEILGVSFQRVQQLASSSAADTVAERPARYRTKPRSAKTKPRG